MPNKLNKFIKWLFANEDGYSYTKQGLDSNVKAINSFEKELLKVVAKKKAPAKKAPAKKKAPVKKTAPKKTVKKTTKKK